MYKWFKWCVSDLRPVSDWLNSRGYPCIKGHNSSASQRLSGEQVRLCSGHHKAHFWDHSERFLGCGGWGCTGRGGGSSRLSHYQRPSKSICLILIWRTHRITTTKNKQKNTHKKKHTHKQKQQQQQVYALLEFRRGDASNLVTLMKGLANFSRCLTIYLEMYSNLVFATKMQEAQRFKRLLVNKARQWWQYN